MTQHFQRDNVTWLGYAMVAFYGYYLNILGPITPFLQDELKLTYTAASLHFTMFGIGMVLAGLAGHRVIERIGTWRAVWLGIAGLCGGAVVLALGRSPLVTVAAAFLMGTIGTLDLVLGSPILADHHGEQRSVALSEANVLGSLAASLAALMVGWFAGTAAGWRLALVIGAFIAIVLRLGLGRARALLAAPAAASAGADDPGHGLPLRFWVYWTALVLSVAVEFCMIFWSATYLEQGLGLPRVAAAQAVSLFTGGMIIGRLTGSRLVQRLTPTRLVIYSLVLAGAGFLVFWLTPDTIIARAGLLLTGLGVASLYPLIVSLAIGAAGSQTVQAGAACALASGVAILALPFVLGRLADAAGIRPAYALVLLLLAAAFAIVQLVSRRPRPGPAAAAGQ